MRRILKRPLMPWWSLALALFVVLMPSRQASAQMMGYGMGYGYPWMGYGYPWMGYGYGMGFGYPWMGYGFSLGPAAGYGGMSYPGMGLIYPGIGYGGYGYGGLGYGYGGMGYVGLNGVGFWNPAFGVGLTPLGTQSYMMETRLLGRVPRVSSGGYGPSYYRPSNYRGQ